jgi:choline dehydrogenase
MANSIAEHNQAIAQKPLKGAYDYIVVGAGAAGSVVAGELSKTGAEVLVIESGPADTAPTIGNPSVWFYNVGSPLDFALPIKPAPQVNNRGFNMALGHVLGGGSSINAMVWTRGMERDYDSWAEHGVQGWAFKDVLPMLKRRRIGRAAPMNGVARGDLCGFENLTIPIRPRQLFWKPRVRWASHSLMM